MMERALELAPRWEIYQQSGGIQFLSINTLYQLLAMVERKDPALDAANTFLMIPDLFHYWLTGRKACEFTDATSTQFYRAATGGWSTGLLAGLGIPTDLFPEVVSPGTVLGPLLSGVAEETGLGGLPVIAPAAHDTASAIVAVPAESEYFAWLSSGTWSLLGGISVEPLVTPEAMEANFSSYGGPGGRYLPWKNIMGLWLVQECRRAWSRTGDELSYDQLTGLAAAAEPFAAILNPDDPSFLAPKDMPEAIAAFCHQHGQPAPASRGEMLRSVLESLALSYRWTLETLGRLQGRRFDVLHVVGGGSRNRLLCQFTADACGIPVTAGPVEATAIGNVALQAVALGDLGSLEEARQIIRRSFEVETYEPNDRAAWDAAYERFLVIAH
jgi:rhamnulokinase